MRKYTRLPRFLKSQKCLITEVKICVGNLVNGVKIKINNNMKAVKLGRRIPVENKDRKFGSANDYQLVWVEDENGKCEEPLLFTANDIDKARERAKNNPEDVKEQSVLWNLLT